MKLEDYFDFVAPDQICLKGQPIGIEQVLLYYLKGYGAEEIAEQLPTVTLDQINATIVYYQQNQAKIDDYLAGLKTWQERRYLKYLANPLPMVQRLRSLK